MNAVPLAESTQLAELHLVVPDPPKGVAQVAIATENATEVTALTATKVCALAAMSGPEAAAVISRTALARAR